MLKKVYIFTFIWLLSNQLSLAHENDKLFSGQASAWGNYNRYNSLPLWLGIRYIPALDYKISLGDDKSIDFEASANIYGDLGTNPFDTITTDAAIKPYRAWTRYSTNQFELRAGLQKINFGSATLLRPLMWFDQIDPRDPLQLTDGVWGLLGRYYFLDNANLWLWGLYGNNKAKAWDIGQTSNKFPELGGRFQVPLPKGEAAVTYHFREADTRGLGYDLSEVPEHRIGIDGKWDVEAGVWFEAAWIGKQRNIGMLTNQEMLNLGTDYTFPLGNGLYVIVEHLFMAFDEKPFNFGRTTNFSGLSASYPLGLLDNISAIFYHDWTNDNNYSFLNLHRQYDDLSIYIMAYWNPDKYVLPQQGESGSLFAGKGLQLMVVYNL